MNTVGAHYLSRGWTSLHSANAEQKVNCCLKELTTWQKN